MWSGFSGAHRPAGLIKVCSKRMNGGHDGAQCCYFNDSVRQARYFGRILSIPRRFRCFAFCAHAHVHQSVPVLLVFGRPAQTERTGYYPACRGGVPKADLIGVNLSESSCYCAESAN